MHAIILPCRDWNRYLRWCLASIAASAELTGITDYVVLVIDGGSSKLIERRCCEGRCGEGIVSHLGRCAGVGRWRHISHPLGREFNKAELLNVGIEIAVADYCADVLTFLDADAIVGPRWLEGVRCLEAPCLTRLCYRVRFLSMAQFKCLEPYGESQDGATLAIRGLFRKWEDYPVSGEFWGSPDDIYQGPKPPPPFGAHVFGTSQFSIRRDVLGDLRFNEDFVGRGYEDQWFNRELWRREGAGYCAALLTEPDFAMLHVRHPVNLKPGDPWDSPEALKRNKALYRRT